MLENILEMIDSYKPYLSYLYDFIFFNLVTWSDRIYAFSLNIEAYLCNFKRENIWIHGCYGKGDSWWMQTA